MLSFPLILTGVLGAAGLLLAAILLIVVLPRRESHDEDEGHVVRAPKQSRNGEGFRL